MKLCVLIMVVTTFFASISVAETFPTVCELYNKPTALFKSDSFGKNRMYDCKTWSASMTKRNGTMTSETLGISGVKKTYDYGNYCRNARIFFDDINFGNSAQLTAIIGDALKRTTNRAYDKYTNKLENHWIAAATMLKNEPLDFSMLILMATDIHQEKVTGTALDTFIAGLFTGDEAMIELGLEGGREINDAMARTCGWTISSDLKYNK